MTHDIKLYNEIKIQLNDTLRQLENLGFSHQDIFVFFDNVESLAHCYAIEALELRDMEFDHMPQNNPAKY